MLKEDSMSARLTALEVGETYCEAVRMTLAQAAEGLTLAAEKDRLGRIISKAISRVSTNGSKFSQETVTTLLRDKAVLILIAITRITEDL